MRMATNKWNIRLTSPSGKSGYPFYYGFKTKKEAMEIAKMWEKNGWTAEITKK